jgi:hypothetical protein
VSPITMRAQGAPWRPSITQGHAFDGLLMRQLHAAAGSDTMEEAVTRSIRACTPRTRGGHVLDGAGRVDGGRGARWRGRQARQPAARRAHQADGRVRCGGCRGVVGLRRRGRGGRGRTARQMEARERGVWNRCAGCCARAALRCSSTRAACDPFAFGSCSASVT